MSSGVSEAFYAAVQAMAAVIGVTPLPPGINKATVGDWDMVLNASLEPTKASGWDDPIGPYEVRARNNQYLAVAAFDPSGGAIGGMGEDQFIAEMTAAVTA